MTQPTTVIIKPNGTIRFLVSEGSKPFLDGAVVRRASHIEPVNPIMRYVFYMLRHWFGEKGKMAEFTRLWPCLWRINLAPIGQGILPNTYRNRQAAINAEIGYLYEHFI